MGPKTESWLPLPMLALLGGATWLAGDFQVYLASLVLAWFVVGLGANLIMGYGGILSLGSAMTFGLGAYLYAIFATKLHLLPVVAFIIAILLAGLLSLLLILPTLRLPELYLAVSTFSLVLISQQLIIQLVPITNGPFGFQLATVNFWGLGSERSTFIITAAVALVAFYAMRRLVASEFTLALSSVKTSNMLGNSLGINPWEVKAMALFLGSCYIATGGALYAIIIRAIEPSQFGMRLALDALVLVFLGGIGRFYGPLIGAAFVAITPNLLVQLNQYSRLVSGLVLVVILVLAPQGILSVGNRLLTMFKERRG